MKIPELLCRSLNDGKVMSLPLNMQLSRCPVRPLMHQGFTSVARCRIYKKTGVSSPPTSNKHASHRGVYRWAAALLVPTTLGLLTTSRESSTTP
jgi:hypothetical protein